MRRYCILTVIGLGLAAVISLMLNRQETPGGKTIDAWIALVHDRDPLARAEAINILGGEPDERVKKLVLAALDDPSIKVRITAFNACMAYQHLTDDQKLSAVTRFAKESSGEAPFAILGDRFESCIRSLGTKAAPLVPELMRVARELSAKPEKSAEDQGVLARIAAYIGIIGGRA